MTRRPSDCACAPPRQLWDANYTDESWIGQPVDLIPRMKSLVNDNYPGTRTAITEYNWGALNSIDGGLAEADVLGIFGREGLDLATLWAPPQPSDPGAFAFRMFLNYDGKGSAFGDTSVRANSANPDQVSVFAAQRREDHAVTLMVINKSTQDLTAPLSIAGMPGNANARVYQYGQADPSTITALPNQAITRGRTSLNLPAYSITELVIPPAGHTTHGPGTDHPPLGQPNATADQPGMLTSTAGPVPPAGPVSTVNVHPVTSSTVRHKAADAPFARAYHTR